MCCIVLCYPVCYFAVYKMSNYLSLVPNRDHWMSGEELIKSFSYDNNSFLTQGDYHRYIVTFNIIRGGHPNWEKYNYGILNKQNSAAILFC